jgi:hypothetical protein
MLKKARTHRSMALEADARHLFTDVYTSAGVVLGLLAVMATGWLWLDPLIAIAVALNILREGGSLVWRSAEGLMDRAVEPDVRPRSTRHWTPSAPGDPLRPRGHAPRRRSGASSTCTCTCRLEPGRWAARRRCAPRSSRR